MVSQLEAVESNVWIERTTSDTDIIGCSGRIGLELRTI